MVDPVAAEVVKRIFQLADEGKSPRAIAEILTEEKILISAAYAEKYHTEQSKGKKYSDPYLWSVSTVRTILNRQEYLGHTILHKSVGTNFKLHKRKPTEEGEQYLFPQHTRADYFTGAVGQRSEKEKACGESHPVGQSQPPIERIPFLCGLWHTNDPANPLQQKGRQFSVFLPLWRICQQGECLFRSRYQC